MAKEIKNSNEIRVMVKVPHACVNSIANAGIGEVRSKTNNIVSFASNQKDPAKAMALIQKDLEKKMGMHVLVEEDKIQSICNPVIINNEEEIAVPKFLWNVLAPILNLFKKKDKHNPIIPLPENGKSIIVSADLYNIIQSGFTKAWENGYNGHGIIAGVNDTGCGPNDYIQYESNLNTAGFNEPIFERDNDSHGHGTHCAGTICSRINNPKNVVGGAYACTMKIFKSGAGSFYTSDLIQAIEESVKQGVKVLNNSWGGSYSSFMQDTITQAYKDGTIIVKALGNENIECQDAYKDCVLVSAYTKFNNPAKFSNWSPEDKRLNTIAAYGVDILSTIPNNKTAFMSGTSMATPLVVAAIVLLLQKYPNKSVQEIVSILFTNCILPIEDKKYGLGILNLDKEFRL